MVQRVLQVLQELTAQLVQQDQQVLQVQPLPSHTHTVQPQDRQHLAVLI
jgi:hypothetical protein